jgi:hypothetical protein
MPIAIPNKKYVWSINENIKNRFINLNQALEFSQMMKSATKNRKPHGNSTGS